MKKHPQIKKEGHHVEIRGTIESFRADIVSIGNYVVIGAGTKIITHCPIKFYKGMSVDINIGNNVYVGTDGIILPGVTIGDNVVIGAGSVVSRDIPANSIAAGNPCRVVRPITEKEAMRLKLLSEQSKVADGIEPIWPKI